MMESNSSLFNKPLLEVAIVAKYIQCVPRVIFKICLVLKFWFQVYRNYNKPHLGNFC